MTKTNLSRIIAFLSSTRVLIHSGAKPKDIYNALDEAELSIREEKLKWIENGQT